MGIECTFLQANDKDEAQDIIDYGLTLPADFKPGRRFTYAELRQVLDHSGYEITYEIGDGYWHAHFKTPDGKAVRLYLYSEQLDGYPTDENIPAEIFWKNTPDLEKLPFVQALANICGTMTIYCDCDVGYFFVFSDQSK
jgi:hypothetical protein